MGICAKVKNKFPGCGGENSPFPTVLEIFKFVKSQNTDGNLGSENWRFYPPQNKVSQKNSGEVPFAKSIVRYLLPENVWVDQVPTCAGLFEIRGDTHSNLDLVFKSAALEFEFIELKLTADSYCEAAKQALTYAAVYDFCRERFKMKLGQQSQELMAAKKIDLIVLAPEEYYGAVGMSPSKLGNRINEELHQLTFVHSKFEKFEPMSFQFQALGGTNSECQEIAKKYASSGGTLEEGDVKRLREIVATRRKI